MTRTLKCVYYIFSCDSPAVQRISRYLFKAFQLRNDILQELTLYTGAEHDLLLLS